MKVNRNQPCPCGSSKKFKHCCGALQTPAITSSDSSATAEIRQPLTIPQALELALQYQQQGQFQDAEVIYRQILQVQPELAEIHLELGNVLEAQDKIVEATACYRHALTLKPDLIHAYSNLGYVLGMQNQFAEAEHCYRRALELEPNVVQVLHNLASVLNIQNKFAEAVTYYHQALQLKPDFVETHNNLGNALQSLGQIEEAATCYLQALQLKPDFAEAYSNLGNALQAQEKFENAAACYRQALQLKPDLANAYRGLGDVLRLQGLLEDAKENYRQVLTLKPNDAGAKIRLAMLLPVIMASPKSILKSRQQLVTNLNELLNSHLQFQDPFREGGVTNFFLVYHGLNDRNLQINLANLYEYACSSLLYTAPHCHQVATKLRSTSKEKSKTLLNRFTDSFFSRGHTPPSLTRKIKIGFVSNFLKQHTIGKVLRGIIANLSRERFTVQVFFISPVDDEISQFIKQHADYTESLPLDLNLARQRLAHQQLDILCYPDIGMDNFTYFLAFARLAPVQCTTWGHPVTTGIRNIDYYISSHYLETEESEDHYSETLVQLNSLLTFYYRPTFPTSQRDRSYFGLSDQHHLYLCPQSLFKLHPEFDPILAEILTQDSQGQLVLVEGLDKHWSLLLKKRFSKTIPTVLERIQFLPRQSFDDYLNLMTLAEVMLDPFHFGGGSTTYEALSIGIPIVTWPSSLLRGRFAYGCYKRMGVMDCVAETPQRYVEIALHLGTDPAYRDQIKHKILAANQVLYEDMKVVREFEKFWVAAVEKNLS